MTVTLDTSLTNLVARQDGFELLKQPYQDSYGRWIVEGIVARPGIYEYQDGLDVRSELVTVEALSRSAFLGGLRGVPVTIEHPPEEVTPSNNKQYAVGTCLSAELVDGGAVKVCLVIDEADGIRFISDERVRGLSPHYYADTRDKSGTSDLYDAQYDSIQVSRERPNHIALTKSPRGGHKTSIRIDSFTSDEVQMDKIKAKLLESGMDPEAVDKVLAVLAELASAMGGEPDVEVEVKAEDMAGEESEKMDMKGMYDALDARVKALEDMMSKQDADEGEAADEDAGAESKQDADTATEADAKTDSTDEGEPKSEPVATKDSTSQPDVWGLLRSFKITR